MLCEKLPSTLHPSPSMWCHKYPKLCLNPFLPLGDTNNLHGMRGFSSPPLASSPQRYFLGGSSTLTYLKITTTTNKPKQKKSPPWMTEFVTIIKYSSYSSGCVSPAKSYCSQHHMVAFFFPFLIDLEQQFVSPVSQHHSMHCLTETT